MTDAAIAGQHCSPQLRPVTRKALPAGRAGPGLCVLRAIRHACDRLIGAAGSATQLWRASHYCLLKAFDERDLPSLGPALLTQDCLAITAQPIGTPSTGPPIQPPTAVRAVKAP